MSLKLITPAASAPVTLEEAKVQCRVDEDITTDDSLIESLVIAATEMAEQEIGRALITQTWERVIDAFPESEIELGQPPVASIASIIYVDSAGDTQTLDSAAYTLDTSVDPGWALPAEGYTWPDTLDTAEAVRVRFVAGYGDAASVPAPVKNWILLKVAELHPNGDKLTPDQRQAIDRLLDRYRVWGV